MIYCRRHRLVERQDGVVGIMDMLKRVLSVLGAAFGSLALFYLVFEPDGLVDNPRSLASCQKCH